MGTPCISPAALPAATPCGSRAAPKVPTSTPAWEFSYHAAATKPILPTNREIPPRKSANDLAQDVGRQQPRRTRLVQPRTATTAANANGTTITRTNTPNSPRLSLLSRSLAPLSTTRDRAFELDRSRRQGRHVTALARLTAPALTDARRALAVQAIAAALHTITGTSISIAGTDTTPMSIAIPVSMPIPVSYTHLTLPTILLV